LIVVRLLGLVAAACLLVLLARGGRPPEWLLPLRGRWAGKLLAAVALFGMVQAGPWPILWEASLYLSARLAGWVIWMPLVALLVFAVQWAVLWGILVAHWERSALPIKPHSEG
jgi:hypothetical protein